jgi:NAD-dependent dihydropyrimidine dehydrogenase PreA subunit
MKILYFTGTGNSLYVAKKIGGDLLSIPQLIKNNQYIIEDDIVGIICPVYCWTAPNIVKQYLKKVEINTNYLFIIMTYGGANHGCFNALYKIFDDKNMNVDYSNTILMVDNFSPLFDISKEKEKSTNFYIDKKIENIKKDIFNRQSNYKINTLKDTFASAFSPVLYKLLNHFINFKIDNEFCDKCKTCVNVCPKGNIQIIEKGPIIGNNCENCLSCHHNCPKSIIHVTKESNQERFINPNIKLSELILSNKQ